MWRDVGAAVAHGLLLVDDHPLFRSGFAALAASAWPDRPLLTAQDGEAALALVADRQDIAAAIIDIQLPGRDGFEIAIAMAELAPSVSRILISGREDAAARTRARKCGASALIAKSSPAASIVATIEAVLAGDDGFADDAGLVAMPQLSPRQIEVLDLLAAGRSNLQICTAMGIAERTVRAHLTEIFDALGVNSRVQAILQAQRLGLIG
ncbi:MAG: Transcriptional regulatory protein DegU [Pseudomonadota bacterium]|jgi:DNA-binding NarL/FixJ family response regulator